MKTNSLHIRDELVPVPAWARQHRISTGFTLVEMLVVITIIGILAALVIPAAMAARNAAKRATITMEVKQLEMACQAYKEKFGEYPPDFSDVTTATGQATILRHLARAFPRYQPGISTGIPTNDWAGFVADVSNSTIGWGLPVNSTDSTYLLSPATALTFWLGGCPQWTVPLDNNRPVTAFAGFAADPTNPFSSVTNCPSRINPFYDFNLTCLYYQVGARATPTPGGLWAWPSSACSKTSPYCPLVYFRAENGNYTTDGAPLVPLMTNAKYSALATVWPAIDVRLSTALSGPFVWVNPSSVQIFSAGLGLRYAAPNAHTAFYSTAAIAPNIVANEGPYEFPTGVNYQPDTYDDITNFSSGTLEDNMNKP